MRSNVYVLDSESLKCRIPSGKLDKFVAVARPTKLLTQPVIGYSQLEDSVCRDTDIPLPKGTCWTRDLKEFLHNFEEIIPK